MADTKVRVLFSRPYLQELVVIVKLAQMWWAFIMKAIKIEQTPTVMQMEIKSSDIFIMINYIWRFYCRDYDLIPASTFDL